MTVAAQGQQREHPVILWFGVAAGPAAWTAHLLGSYLLVANGCAIGDAALKAVIVAMSAVLAIVAFASSWLAWRADEPGDGAGARVFREPTTRGAFMTRSGALLGILFGIAILAETAPLLFIEVCS